jgi:serine phosphatase RsbU (regulator of sigma subunit)/Tfp pilus assembly protein PilF
MSLPIKKHGIKESKIDDINLRLWNNRFDSSKSVEKEAAKNLSNSEKAQYLKGIAYAKLNIAVANFFQSNNDIALKYLTEAYHWFETNTEEKGYARAILLKGNIYESFGDYEKTLSLWLLAFKVSKEIKDIESEGESCNQLGLIYSRLNNFEKALEYFNKGLKIREELGDENGAASSLNRIGMVLRQTNKYEESLQYYFRSLEIRERNKQVSAIPWTLLGIANTYEEMKKYPEALDYYERAITGSDKRCALQCLMGSGRVYNRTGDNEKAEKRLTESLQMAQNLKSLVLLAEAHSALASHFELSGQPVKALDNFKKFIKEKELYQSSETRSRLSNIEVAYAIEKSEQEKEIYRLKHVELKLAYDIIDEKNKDITASINYASRIQKALLPEQKEIRGLADRCFIFYLPKDIVSGDFYWFTKVQGKMIIAVGDCTGHGVPGALMSMLGISFLEEIVNKREVLDSSEILSDLRIEIQRALHQKDENEGTKDGMDISLCIIDDKKKTLQYSGAYNDLYFIRNNELLEYHADHMPIGIYDLSGEKFTKYDIQTLPGDIIFMFSDGYADQFGGPNCKKYKYSALRAFLLKIHNLPVQTQKKELEKEFYNWKGESSQVDDVVILGLKI